MEIGVKNSRNFVLIGTNLDIDAHNMIEKCKVEISLNNRNYNEQITACKMFG